MVRRGYGGSDFEPRRHHVPLFAGDWFAGVRGLLDDVERVQDRNARRREAMIRRLDARVSQGRRR
jgi:hypothetical protein